MLLVAIVLGVAARIVYWVYTHHAFEDALITVTQARNAAEGIGLPARNSLGYVIAALQPTWASLRPSELSTFKEEAPGAAAEYHVVKKFQWGQSVFSSGGVTYSDGETEFYVLRHQ